MDDEILLSARDLSVRFGGVLAVNGVSFEVRRGEVFTLIGPNGAGKTTVFNLISRIYAPSAGRIVYAGHELTRVPPHAVAALGIARTFQNIELFEHASVLQNLLIGRHVHRRTGFVDDLLFTPRARRNWRTSSASCRKATRPASASAGSSSRAARSSGWRSRAHC